jgi:hypothetical protein
MRYLQSKSVFEHYLKRFNESNTNDIIQTIKDILLPISDMGHDISIIEDDKDNFTQFVIRVVSWGEQSLLITDEVKEEFIRMKDYLESEGYNSIEVLYHLATPGAISSRDIKGFDDFMKYESWQGVKIQNLLFVAK